MERLQALIVVVFEQRAKRNQEGADTAPAFLASVSRAPLGVRLTLGATPRSIGRMVIGRGLLLTGIGLGVGIIASFYFAHFLALFLFDVKPRDPIGVHVGAGNSGGNRLGGGTDTSCSGVT